MSTAAASIRRLPQVVADAIAAGEVIERPASVIKELLENAIDAHARRVTVVARDGGLTQMLVTDDGDGIAADDLPLAVERHATSKVSSLDDLAAITSLGFRGEALASIAAVSELTITSRRPPAEAAARLRIRGGEAASVSVAARDPGTSVEVCDLFFATPARLRFMKSPRAEAAAISRVVSEQALATPEVAISLALDARSSIASPGGGLESAARAVLGAQTAAQLIPIEGDGEIRVSGLISEPRASRGSRSGLVFVINGRRVQNRMLQVAVEDAYRGLLPVGRYPLGVVRVEIAPDCVDSNVHPAKREVRLVEEGSVFTAVQRACWAALRGASVYTAVVGAAATAEPHEAGAAASRPAVALSLGLPARSEPVMLEDAPPDPRAGDGATVAQLGALRCLGQIERRWLVAEGSGGRVVLVDPHAAHEKILYEGLRQRWREDSAAGGPGQMLLMPEIVDCDPLRWEQWERHGAELAGLGWQVEAFGPRTLRCGGVPATARSGDVADLLTATLDALDGVGDAEQRHHRVAALIACHSAVRFGDALAPDEQQRLLDQLGRTDNATTCPHGRPTVMILEDATLRRAFLRPT